MAEKHEFATLVRASWGDAVVVIVTFLLVVFRDLTEGILVGFGIGALLFLHRMAQAVQIERAAWHAEADVPDTERERPPYHPALATDQNVIVYRISGACFFGAAAAVGAALDRIAEHPKAYVIDFSNVAILDSTAAATIEGFLRKARRSGAKVYITGASRPIRRVLLMHGVRPPDARFRSTIADAFAAAHCVLDTRGNMPPPSGTRADRGTESGVVVREQVEASR